MISGEESARCFQNGVVNKRDLMQIVKSFDLLLTSNLVSHLLGLNDSDVIDDSLVEVEILGQSIGVKTILANNLFINQLTFRSTAQ